MRQMLSRMLVAGMIISALVAWALPAVASAATVPTKNEQAVIDLVNAERTKRDLPALVVSEILVRSARGHSTQMANKKYFSHDSYNGESFSKRIIRYGYTRSGYSSWRVGEDIAWGTNIFSTPVAIVQSWMGSSAHRAVILDPKVKELGVGRAFTSSFKGQQNVTLYTLDTGARTK